ncbi:uncharacterized protein TRIADDRAFT_52042 [Trichoplax adhaerens]|uniref:Solute carrier organic anion transporter family member n=1 Tax=Trichoplax adhaerens TaxID=10228 RepID=B3RLL2_TRIAD|nr:hypothetical protein TRIADDRAFT_52042 [Trichoplax adhaerens]EDV28800.1 hypothetical protein TRIADDRAFT_52042 [Trichoplax adhaerens]|eukprot:XP_002108002.1 hypothetical protein TRIADDRAFT_52042 [Trichoplax adhaerens]
MKDVLESSNSDKFNTDITNQPEFDKVANETCQQVYHQSQSLPKTDINGIVNIDGIYHHLYEKNESMVCHGDHNGSSDNSHQSDDYNPGKNDDNNPGKNDDFHRNNNHDVLKYNCNEENQADESDKVDKCHDHNRHQQNTDNHYPQNGKLKVKLRQSKCGYFNYQPAWLQQFNSPKYFLFFLCTTILLAHMQAHGIKATIVPSLEKRYNMTSTYLGSIMSVNDAIGGVCGPLLTFVIAQRYKNKWIGWSIVITGLGFLTFALPHFLAPLYHYSTSEITNSLCSNSNNFTHTKSNCSTSDSSSHWVYTFLFVIAQSAVGCGLTIQYCLGIAYLDENVKPTVSPLFIAIINMMSVIGTSGGLFLGGIMNNIYINWPTITTDLLPSDVKWIGAWWLSYLGTGSALLLFAPLFFAFPHHLSTYKDSKRARRRCQSAEISNNDKSYETTIGQLLTVTRQLVCNSLFMLPTIGLTLEKITIGGLITFLPKYVQSQTGLSIFVSSIAGGGAVIIGSSVGQFLGGYLTKRWKLQGSAISKFCAYACFINFLTSGVLLIQCGNIPIIGIGSNNNSNNYQPNSLNLSTTYSSAYATATQCSTGCNCQNIQFSPICGSDGLVYASPCNAGCRTKSINSRNEVDCDAIYPLFIGVFISSFASFIVVSPTISIILRNIPENQRAYGIALRGFFTKIFGNIIGTITIGGIIDFSCSLWNTNCSDSKFCWQYDNVKMSLYLFACVAILKFLKLLTFILLWHVHSKEEKVARGRGKNDLPMTPSMSSFADCDINTVEIGNSYVTAF